MNSIADKLTDNDKKSQPIRFITPLNLIKVLNKSIPFLVGIYIFFNPFPHTTAIKEICFYLSVFIVIILILSKKKDFTLKTPLLLPFGIFILWSLLSIFFAINKENSIHDFYSHLIRYAILYYILINFFNSEKHLLYLSWIIVISSTIFIMGGIIYFYFILGNPLSARFGVHSFVQTPVNIIGIISIFAIFLALNNFNNERQLSHKIFFVGSLLVLTIGIFLTQSRSTLIAIFVGGFFFFFNDKKQLFVFISFFLIIIVLSPIRNRFSPDYHGGFKHNRRIDISYITLEVIKDYPLTGIGFGLQSYENLDLKKYRKELGSKKYRKRRIITDPHNMVLDIAVRLGVIGLAFSFYIVFVFFKMCRNIIKHGKSIFLKSWGRSLGAAFIAVTIIGLFYPIFSHMPEVVFCLIFSMLTIVYRLNTAAIIV